jgi:hypothetical protein
MDGRWPRGDLRIRSQRQFRPFKQDVNRRTPEPLVATPLTEILPQLTPDGRFVLYAARPFESERPFYYKPHTYKLMRVPVSGGTPAEVSIGGLLDEFRCALAPGKRCVLRTTLPGGYFAYYDLDPIKGKGRELARIKSSIEVLGDWDVSPDGTQVAIPNHDSREARIRVVALDATVPKRDAGTRACGARLGQFEWPRMGCRRPRLVRICEYDGWESNAVCVSGWSIPFAWGYYRLGRSVSGRAPRRVHEPYRRDQCVGYRTGLKATGRRNVPAGKRDNP